MHIRNQPRPFHIRASSGPQKISQTTPRFESRTLFVALKDYLRLQGFRLTMTTADQIHYPEHMREIPGQEKRRYLLAPKDIRLLSRLLGIDERYFSNTAMKSVYDWAEQDLPRKVVHDLHQALPRKSVLFLEIDTYLLSRNP